MGKTLECRSVYFFSEGDERSFFRWLEGIDSVIRLEPVNHSLLVHLKDEPDLPDDSLRELIAVFYRYSVDMKQLTQFVNEDNATWFKRNRSAYWHEAVFGGD